MDLNLPVLESLLSCKSLLIAGTGGGFDVFCGIPIYYELRKRKKEASHPTVEGKGLAEQENAG